MNRARVLGVLAALAAATPAHGAFLAGEALDTMADILAIVVLIFVPIAAIVVFWLVHVLPEKIAHKRHHPQRDAITTLCLLSLLFGGLLWPLAWLWAYTKPIGYRVAYGTDRHHDYFIEMREKYRAGALSEAEIVHLQDEVRVIAEAGALTPELRALQDELTRPPVPALVEAKEAREAKA